MALVALALALAVVFDDDIGVVVTDRSVALAAVARSVAGGVAGMAVVSGVDCAVATATAAAVAAVVVASVVVAAVVVASYSVDMGDANVAPTAIIIPFAFAAFEGSASTKQSNSNNDIQHA